MLKKKRAYSLVEPEETVFRARRLSTAETSLGRALDRIIPSGACADSHAETTGPLRR
jgi:hypothetical protein